MVSIITTALNNIGSLIVIALILGAFFWFGSIIIAGATMIFAILIFIGIIICFWDAISRLIQLIRESKKEQR